MTVRIDLHVHSKFSSRPSQWILQKIGCPECFTEPLNLYRLAKLKGMTHVTITDHNRIAGALEIAHLPDTFVSEEVTTYFPEDGCKVHVLALNITEAQHNDIQKVRDNIYALVDYLVETNIFHIVAHPLYSVNGRLKISHFEKMLLLFKNFEMNGARNDASNNALTTILAGLSPTVIELLADRHDLAPKMPKPWLKNITGGSDDHSSLNIARTYTEIPRSESLSTALQGIYNHLSRVIRQPPTPLTFAHNLYGIAYQYYRNKFDLERYVGSDTLLDFIDHCLQPDPAKSHRKLITKLYGLWQYRKRPRFHVNVPETLAALIRHESGRLLHDNPDLMKIATTGATHSGEREEKWFEFVNRTSSRMVLNFARSLMNHLSGANVFNIFQTIGEAGGLYAMAAPYLISFSYFSQDRVFGEKIIAHFSSHVFPWKPRSNPRKQRVVAHFTESLSAMQTLGDTLNRVSNGILTRPEEWIFLGCSESSELGDNRMRVFKPIGSYADPDFPDHKLQFPPFMEMLNYCYSKRVTHIHSASPGPVGLTALGVARILKIPVYGTYHRSLEPYRPFLGEDESANDIFQRFMSWYYNQLDRIYVFSLECFNLLRQQGIDPEKITFVPRGFDTDQLQTPHFRRHPKLLHKNDARIRLIYAGPLTRENNLPLLAEVFKILLTTRKNLHLDVIGQGPYLGEMQRVLAGFPCTFYGPLSASQRAEIFVNGALFVYPGTIVNDGRPLLEAQGSGLPVLVPDHENTAPYTFREKTGLNFKCNDATHLYEVLLRMIDDRHLRTNLGVSARSNTATLAVDAAAFQEAAPEATPIQLVRDIQLAEAV